MEERKLLMPTENVSYFEYEATRWERKLLRILWTMSMVMI